MLSALPCRQARSAVRLLAEPQPVTFLHFSRSMKKQHKALAISFAVVLTLSCGSGGNFNLISIEEEWALGNQLAQDIARQMPVSGPVSVPLDLPPGRSTLRLTLSAGAEVVCIVRPLADSRAKSRVVVLDRASPEFLAHLADAQRRQESRTATAYEVPAFRIPDFSTPPSAQETSVASDDPVQNFSFYTSMQR